VVGTITIVYDHHTRGLTEKLTALQHDFEGVILANTHVHLDEHMCVEAILVKDRANRIEELGNTIRKLKGVLKGDLSLASLGKQLR
jgi:CopG family nickel-responsive transcriptional regulator